MGASSSSSKIEEQPPHHQVFISFHGKDLSPLFYADLVRTLLTNNIQVHLVQALKSVNIKVFIDNDAEKRQPLETLLTKIEESRIALAIFSMKYTESTRCLRELALIKDCVEKGKLVVIPIFYKFDKQYTQFGEAFRDLKERDTTKRKVWVKAVKWILELDGSTVHEDSPESEILNEIVNEVKKVLKNFPSQGSGKDRTFGIKKRLNELKEKLDLHKITRQLPMIIGCLLLLFFVLQKIALMSCTCLTGEGVAIDRIAENVPEVLEYCKGTVNGITSQLGKTIVYLLILFLVLQAYMHTRLFGDGIAINRIVKVAPKVVEYIPADNPRDKYTEFHTEKCKAKHEISSSEAKENADFLDRNFTKSQMECKVKPPKIQVFINFRGDQLRNNFVGYLVDALRRSEINVFIDNQAQRGEDLNTLFKRIEDSGLAIVVFSSRYTESEWCLEELVRIKERVDQGLLKVLPIFYKVTATNVKKLKGDFGDHFRDKEYMYKYDEPMIKRWKEAIMVVSHKFGLTFDEKSSVLEINFIETIAEEVLKILQDISSGQSSR